MSPRKAVFVNPSGITTGTAFVMPAAQATLAGAVPANVDLELKVVDEAIERFDPNQINAGDLVCVSALTNNVLEAYRVARQAKVRGAMAILGGPHPTLLPEEALRHGADAVVRGDGDTILSRVLEDCISGRFTGVDTLTAVAVGGVEKWEALFAFHFSMPLGKFRCTRHSLDLINADECSKRSSMPTWS